MNSLSELPTELLSHVFACLNSAPPSASHFDSLPAFRRSNSTEQPLKNASLVCRSFRTVVLDQLFYSVRVRPGEVEDFLRFLDQSNLSRKVQSILVEVLSSSNVSIQPSWWCQLLEQVPAARIIIQCEPQAYKFLFNIDVNLNDYWAFKVPCQYIEFCQSQALSDRMTACNPATGLFAAKPWQGLRVNEGSSLAAYTSYEYFLKKHPSLLASLEQHLGVSPQMLQQLDGYYHALAGSSSMLVATTGMFENLRAFSYVSVFPFYNHVDDILKCVKRMRSLQNLFVKLCPEPGSAILEDAVQAAMGHIDLNDPWSEYVLTNLHKAYTSQKSWTVPYRLANL